MMSSRLAAALARRRVHYGWMIAGVTFLTMLVTAGAVGASCGPIDRGMATVRSETRTSDRPARGPSR